MQPGQVKNDLESCIRYYCWNNILTDEILVGCSPSFGVDSKSEFTSSGERKFFGTGYAAGGIYVKSVGQAKSGISIATEGLIDTDCTDNLGVGLSSATGAGAGVSAGSDSTLGLEIVNEDNGATTLHSTFKAGDVSLGASSYARAGYSDKEMDAMRRNGAFGIGAGASAGAGLYHNGPSIITSIVDEECDDDTKIDASIDSKASADADGSSKSNLNLKIEDSPICVDESGQERCYGDVWTYSRDSCKSCTCSDVGKIDCQDISSTCDPYPVCPDGHYVVEEKASDCCYTYRIVKDDCDVSKCQHCAPRCSPVETVLVYPTDDCCAEYECQCDSTRCMRLGTPPCPSGYTRQVLDASACCPVGKCVPSTGFGADASAGTSLLIGGAELVSQYSGDGVGSGDIKADLKSKNDAKADASADSKTGLSIDVDGDKSGKGGLRTSYSAGDISLGSNAGAGIYGMPGMYGYPYGGYGMFGGNAGAGSNLEVGGGKYSSETKKGDDKKGDIELNLRSASDANANADADNNALIQVSVESCVCVDEEGNERSFGDYWYGADKCTTYTCVDNNNIETTTEQCEEPLPTKAGHRVVREKTSDCCFTYRYVPEDCQVGTCEYKPLRCARYENSVSYKIDECCSTYECVCDESKCPQMGNPPCPVGCSRIVVDQDACCPVPKCVYMNRADARANANAAATINGGKFSSTYGGDSDDGSRVNLGLDSMADASASADSSSDTGLSVKSKGTGKGEGTVVTKYVPGKIDIGAASSSGIGGHYGMGMYPGYGMGYMGANAGASSALDVLPSKYGVDVDGGKAGKGKIDLSLDSSNRASSDAAAKNEVGFNIAVEAEICTDDSGRGRCLGDEWEESANSCRRCVCSGQDNVQCTLRSCDPVPHVPEGSKLVEESNDGCCSVYRVVREECDCSTCQYQAPRCGRNQRLVMHAIDDCCATYECVCEQDSCPRLSYPACPAGHQRRQLNPHECCGVARCVHGYGYGADARSNAGVTIGGMGMSTISGDKIGDGSVKAALSAKSAANADANANSKTNLDLLIEATTCTDESGMERSYGETWYKNGDACHICCCSNKNTIDCETRVCDPYPTAPEGYKVVEEREDDCCHSYKVVEETCDMTKCTDTAPLCNFYEDLVRYDVNGDGCCSTYECSCNPSKCARLGHARCPPGARREVLNTDVCCPIAKCVGAGYGYGADANAASGVTVGGGHYSTHTDGDRKRDGKVDVGLSSDNSAASNANADSSTGLGLSVGGLGKGDSALRTKYAAGDISLGSDASAYGRGYGSGMYGPYGGYGMYGAHSNAGSNLLLGGGDYSSIYGGDGRYGGDVSAKLSSKNKADASASGKSKTGLEVVSEACICQDSVGRERKFGECWTHQEDMCQTCTCVDNNEVRSDDSCD